MDYVDSGHSAGIIIQDGGYIKGGIELSRLPDRVRTARAEYSGRGVMRLSMPEIFVDLAGHGLCDDRRG